MKKRGNIVLSIPRAKQNPGRLRIFTESVLNWLQVIFPYLSRMTKMTNSPWRMLSTAVYGAPNEGKIYGIVEVDVTDAWEMIKLNRKEGRRITMTHLVPAAIGRAIGWKIPMRARPNV